MRQGKQSNLWFFKSFFDFLIIYLQLHSKFEIIEQAGAELGQAQIKLELGFTLIKI